MTLNQRECNDVMVININSCWNKWHPTGYWKHFSIQMIVFLHKYKMSQMFCLFSLQHLMETVVSLRAKLFINLYCVFYKIDVSTNINILDSQLMYLTLFLGHENKVALIFYHIFLSKSNINTP